MAFHGVPPWRSTMAFCRADFAGMAVKLTLVHSSGGSGSNEGAVPESGGVVAVQS